MPLWHITTHRWEDTTQEANGAQDQQWGTHSYMEKWFFCFFLSSSSSSSPHLSVLPKLFLLHLHLLMLLSWQSSQKSSLSHSSPSPHVQHYTPVQFKIRFYVHSCLPPSWNPVSGSKFTQIHFGCAVLEFKWGQCMVCWGGICHRKRDMFLGKEWKDKWAAQREDRKHIWTRKAKQYFWEDPQNRAHGRHREELNLCFKSAFPVHLVQKTWENTGAQKERLRNRYLSCEWMERRDVGNKG